MFAISSFFHLCLMLRLTVKIINFRLVDNLPAATPIFNPETNEIQYEHGYRLGNTVGDRSFINNHLKLTLLCHNPHP